MTSSHDEAKSLPRPQKTPVIGILCDDVQEGARFYQLLEFMMANLWKDETQRPIIYLDLGYSERTPKRSSNLLNNPNIDFVIDLNKENSKPLELKDLIHLLMEKAKNPDARDQAMQLLDEDLVAHFKKYRAYITEGPLPACEKEKVFGRAGWLLGMGPIAGANLMVKFSDTHGLSELVSVYGYSNPAKFGKILDAIEIARQLKNFHSIPSVTYFAGSSNTWDAAMKHSNPIVAAAYRNFIDNVSLSIVDIVSDYVTQKFSGKKVALMATEKTVKMDSYRKCFSERGSDISYPDVERQKNINDGIHAVKIGHLDEADKQFEHAINYLAKKKKAKVIILGCTEIEMGIQPKTLEKLSKKYKITFVDSAKVVAEAVAEKLSKHILSQTEKKAVSLSDAVGATSTARIASQFSIDLGQTRYELADEKMQDTLLGRLGTMNNLIIDSKPVPFNLEIANFLKLSVAETQEWKKNEKSPDAPIKLLLLERAAEEIVNIQNIIDRLNLIVDRLKSYTKGNDSNDYKGIAEKLVNEISSVMRGEEFARNPYDGLKKIINNFQSKNIEHRFKTDKPSSKDKFPKIVKHMKEVFNELQKNHHVENAPVKEHSRSMGRYTSQ